MDKIKNNCIYIYEEEDNKPTLYIRTGLSSKAFITLNLTDIKKDPGLTLDNKGNITEWNIEGNKEIGGEIFLYGTGAPGKGLDELKFTEITPLIVKKMLLLAKEAEKRNYETSGILPGSYYLRNDGSLLLLPGKLVELIKGSLPENLISRGWAQYIPFIGNKTFKKNFSAALFVYSILTGENPWFHPDPRKIGGKKQDRKINPLKTRIKGNKSFPFDFIDARLTGKSDKNQNFSFEEWLEWVDFWEKEPSVQLIEEDKKNEQKQENRYRNKQWLRQHKTLLSGIAIALIVAGSIAGSFIKRALEPPPQAGMSQIETIEYFYQCFNTLDHYTIEKICSADSAKVDIEQIMYLFINSKTQEAYSQNNPMISGEDWAAGKVPEPQPGNMVYGISDLKIKEMGDDIFEADYIKWIPDIPDSEDIDKIMEEGNEFRPPLQYERKDKLTLTEIKGSWFITGFEKISGE